MAGAAAKGRYLLSRLRNLRDLPWVGEARALGLMAGVEVVADRASRRPFPAEARDGDAIVRRAPQHGVILRAVHGNVISLSPPLTVDEPTLDSIVDAVAASIEGAAAEAAPSAGPGGAE